MILAMWWMLVLVIRLPSLLASVCDGNEFACKSGHECVAAEQHCDHVIDCIDGSDELECNYPCRSPHMKPCKDGHCIAMSFFCDRENDCGDWSDELNCTGTSSGLTLNCSSNTFHCEGQVCIPKNWVCDGMDDCSDARDELHCNKTTECKNGFQCGKECILNQWVCDGVTDCADGSDETECGPGAFSDHSCLPEHGWFNCLIKGTKKCMHISRACDGNADCDDQADEGGQCNWTTNCSNSTRCPNECHKTPRGPVCSCLPGYQLNGTSCVDIDECSIDPPLCSQKCANNQGGFECSCSSGYTVGSRNNRSCVASEPEPMLLITTDRDIRYNSLTSKEYGLVRSGISQVHGVAADYEDGFVYWNEKSKDKAGIYKSMLDGSAFQYVVSVGVVMVEDLAIDWVGRHIYFTDSGRKHIVVCDYPATICSIVISGQLDKPRAVAVYPEKGLLFWSDWGSSPHIGSAGMDGLQRTNVITTDIMWPNGLVVDETIQRIYWGDAKLHRIESSRIDGSDRKILPVKVTHPYALDIFENTIFWCDPLKHEVLSVNKFTGKDYEVLIKESSLTPTGIHVHHPSKQSHITNPCQNVICSHLCLLSPSVQGYKCACPVEMTLNKDGRTCDIISAHESSIVIATPTDIYRLAHHQIGKASIFRLPTLNVENIGALAYNPSGHLIVYSDMIQKTICSMHLDIYRQTVLFENVDMVEGLDVDPFTENIYWTEVTRGTVVVGHKNHDGGYDRLVLARDLFSPQGIAIAAQSGRMFIVEGRISHVISVWHMDGTNRQELVQVYGMVSAMSYDGKHLYFSDSLRGTIERIQVNGENRTVLRSHLGTPVAMGASGDSVFWLTQSPTRISWFNKQDPKTIRGFVIDASENITIDYRLMAVVDLVNIDSHKHYCVESSRGCSDICAPTPDGATCLCPLDKVLGEDKRVCHPSNCVGDQWYRCQTGCIPAKYRCDGVNDCPLGEDEIQCRNTTTEVGCTNSQFQCKNGGCVSIHFYCDGNADCQDRSDEPDSCPPYVCMGEGEYSCPNQHHCIPRSAVCDGQADCIDKSDEANCTSTHSMCSSTQFYCSHSHICIPLTWVCDRDSDCQHGEDEDSSVCDSVVKKPPCPLNYLRCPQRPDCMPRMALCDSIAECELGTDAELCAKLNDSFVETATEKPDCLPSQYNCFLGSNECIPIASRCDCRFDCTFGEDEEGCDNLPFSCKKDLFRCPNEMRYINISWVCDGLSDCSNSADEELLLCPTNASTSATSTTTIFPSCSATDFTCKNGECVHASSVCDGKFDCFDGTDEGSGCVKSCQNNGQCPQICVPGPMEPACLCEPGYEALNNGKQCVDVDECAFENKCSQFCNNTKGSYRCSCAPGYSLEPDQMTCKAASGRPMLIVATNHHIEILLNSDIASSRFLVQSVPAIKGIAYHDKISTLYWITTAGVGRSNSEGQSLIYKINDLIPSGLALDKATGNIYYSALKNATRSGQDQSVIRVIAKSLEAEVNIITTQSIITDIALDSPKGILFWSEHTKPYTGRIVRATMDGRSTMWLYSIDKIMYPTAITVDSIKSHIYWTDITLQSISSCDYNGLKQRQEIGITNGQPLSITFFENRLTWSLRDQDVLYSHVINGSTTSQHKLHQKVTQIVTVHSLLEPELPNHCAFSPCNNGICVIKNSSSFTCHCPIGVTVVTSNPFKCSGKSPDGVNDCALGENELQCRNTTTEVGCTSSSRFQCKDGGCISAHFYCDGDADCQDKSDEPDSCPPHVCSGEGDYSCPNQHYCIPRSAVCDGNEDCNDKSDEANCTSTHSMCTSTQFYCSNSHICIPLSWVCDGDSDCRYGEDEDSNICGNVDRKLICPLNYLRCPQHPACMPRKTLCNSIAGCDHLTKEELCAKLNDSIVHKMEPEKPQSSNASCPRYFFQCRPDLKCHSRKLVCDGDAACRKLSVKSLCERLKRNETSRAYTPTSEILREVPSNPTTPKLITQHELQVQSSNCSNTIPSFEASSIRQRSQDGQVVAEGLFSQIEETLQAVLDGPVHVLSRLFTRKGHNIDFATAFSMDKTPIPINPVWDDFANKTRFVEDVHVQDGNRLVLWKIFRPQAYSADGNLRTVHLMELRTLKKMGFHFIVVINLASWMELAESEKISLVSKQLDLVLLTPDV